MDRKPFGGSGLCVSPLCIGTVNYGTVLPEADAYTQLDAFAAAGGNFIDTAHVYGDWGEGPRAASERIIGAWMRKNHNREEVVLATKGAHPRLDTMHLSRVKPDCVTKDLLESLDCLHTDSIDLYFLHRDDPAVPVGELLDVLEEHRKAGRISAYGCSNWTLSRLQEAQTYAAKHGIGGFTCNQLMWSLADISLKNRPAKDFIPMDQDTYVYHSETGIAAMAYMSLAKGFFTRWHDGETLPESLVALYGQGASQRVYKELHKLHEIYGVSISALCLATLMHKPFASVPIASFDSLLQLRQGLEACTCDIPKDVLCALHAFKVFTVE